MRPLKASLPRFIAVASSIGLLAVFAISSGCQGPDEFFRFSAASQTGAAGSSATGVAGTTGIAGGAGGVEERQRRVEGGTRAGLAGAVLAERMRGKR